MCQLGVRNVGRKQRNEGKLSYRASALVHPHAQREAGETRADERNHLSQPNDDEDPHLCGPGVLADLIFLHHLAVPYRGRLLTFRLKLGRGVRSPS